MNKGTRKWHEFHKIMKNDTNQCRSKQSLVAKLKSFKLDLGSHSYFGLDKVK